MKKLRERLSVFTVKNPSLAVLLTILVMNVILLAAASAIISQLASDSLGQTDFWSSAYYAFTMILDAGCISNLIADIGGVSLALIIVCILTVLVGMITFTGSVIGYVSSYIANFIDNAKSGNLPLETSGHTIILNWNTRASEIINDLLYTGKKETVAVLSDRSAAEIEREINERLVSTLREEQQAVLRESEKYVGLRRIVYLMQHRVKNRVTVIVREGDTYSSKQLADISISQASSIILLTREAQSSSCGFTRNEQYDRLGRGDTNTIKTVVQVAEMTSREDSADHQTIIVEVEDEWTAKLVDQIILHKEKLQKCHIIPVYVNRVLGQVLSQFSIMPELNTVYSELFSNKGATFYYRHLPDGEKCDDVVREYMVSHGHAVPLSTLRSPLGNNLFMVSDSDSACDWGRESYEPEFRVKLDHDYHMTPRNIVIIGHNSKCKDIMNGFSAFRGEHKTGEQEILNITVIDDQKSLERLDYYRSYPYVTKTVIADVYEDTLIRKTIEDVVDSFDGNTSLLILSDDNAPPEEIDSAALTYLIYVQDIIFRRMNDGPGFRREDLNVIVEILNPKNYDVVHNYSVDNVVISNRYISKMVTQIGRKQELFDFYCDILTYDEEGAEVYESKELYIREASRFFRDGVLPPLCTARELICSVYDASEENNRIVVLGYTSPGGKMTIFSGCLEEIMVELTPDDSLIIFSNH